MPHNLSSRSKSEFLGMPFGTAHGRLLKKILWQFVQQCQQDTCYRCKTKIESIEDLSIEHKEPWYNVSVDLFWSLENIAFSHRRCNIPHRTPRRKTNPAITLSERELRDRFDKVKHLDPTQRGYLNRVKEILGYTNHGVVSRLKLRWMQMGLYSEYYDFNM